MWLQWSFKTFMFQMVFLGASIKRLEVLRHNLETQFDPLFFLLLEFLQILFVKCILSRPSHTEEKKLGVICFHIKQGSMTDDNRSKDI